MSMFGALAMADELIDIPTARKIVFDDFRFEYRMEPFAGGDQQQFLGLGLGPSFELDFRDIQDSDVAPRATFDFSYNYLAAIPGISPGVSIGIQDAANQTSDGRRLYAVTTFRETMDEIPGNVYTDITVGFQAGSLTSAFAGVAMPFSTNLYLLAEDSGFRLSAGLEYRLSHRITFRLIDRENETLLSLSASGKF